MAQRCKVREDGVKEEAQPGAFAASCRSDAVHAVVPIAGANERKTVGSGGKSFVDRSNTMFEECSIFARHSRLTVRFMRICRKERRFQKRRALVQRADIAR